MNESTILLDDTDSLSRKVEFLRQPETYPETTKVDVIETHMSWVFLTDRYVYKLKKPVSYDFLDFKSLEARYKYCLEEVGANQPLAPGIYLGVVPITSHQGSFTLNGKGEVADWLVKMKRLPEEHLLHKVIKDGSVRYEWVYHAAEILVGFYLASPAMMPDPKQYRQQIIKDIELNSAQLLRSKFQLSSSLIMGIVTDLLHALVKYEDLFNRRIAYGRIVDGHGDLRPEHICLVPPVIIDRIEFNESLRIMDVAEELSFLALECEMLGSSVTGQLFLDVYKWKSLDKIPEKLIFFYKAKRALLRANLSIRHLLEKKYRTHEQTWRSRCDAYLRAAGEYRQQLL